MSDERKTPDQRAAQELAVEMAAQIALGHRRFCVGWHDHGPAGVEERWEDWKMPFGRLLYALKRGAEDSSRLDWIEAQGFVVGQDGSVWSQFDEQSLRERIDIDRAVSTRSGRVPSSANSADTSKERE